MKATPGNAEPQLGAKTSHAKLGLGVPGDWVVAELGLGVPGAGLVPGWGVFACARVSSCVLGTAFLALEKGQS